MKFADDAEVVGKISNDEDALYHKQIKIFVDWCDKKYSWLFSNLKYVYWLEEDSKMSQTSLLTVERVKTTTAFWYTLVFLSLHCTVHVARAVSCMWAWCLPWHRCSGPETYWYLLSMCLLASSSKFLCWPMASKSYHNFPARHNAWTVCKICLVNFYRRICLWYLPMIQLHCHCSPHIDHCLVPSGGPYWCPAKTPHHATIVCLESIGIMRL